MSIILKKDLKVNLDPEMGEIQYATDTDEFSVLSNNNIIFRKPIERNKVLKGVGIPDGTLGEDGDMYIDTNTYKEYYKLDSWTPRPEGKTESEYLSQWELKVTYPLNPIRRDGSIQLQNTFDFSDDGVVDKGYVDGLAGALQSGIGLMKSDGSIPMQDTYVPTENYDVVDRAFFESGQMLLIPPTEKPNEIGVIWNDNGVPRIVSSVYLPKLLAPDGASGDYFGVSVAISGDKIVVGAPYDDDNGSGSGSAYIFGTDGSFVTKITAPDGASGDYFGVSVAISQDKIVVGAHHDDDNGTESGSAYIFGTDGSYVTKITAPDGASGDYFGRLLSISQDKIVVGAYYDDDNGSGSGSAYIFGTDGSFITKITAPDGASSDHFGVSVAISQDKIVVGAYGDADNGSYTGSAYIFGTDGSYVTKITAPDGASSDHFGVSVSISQDNIVVGAYNDDDNGTNSGSAYIFNSDGSYVTKITAPDGASDDYFGYSVSISGDKVVVGSEGDDDNGSYTGSAYIFGTDGSYVTKITAPDGASGDFFGVSVSISDDKILVGAYGDDDNGSYTGSAYIFGI